MSRPEAVCDGRANDALFKKNRRPEGFRGKGRLVPRLRIRVNLTGDGLELAGRLRLCTR